MTISVLVSARKNSKYLAKFLFNYLANTNDLKNCEVLVMLNEGDTWNASLVSYFQGKHNIRFFYEDLGLGRGGLHTYFNTLLKKSGGEWVMYACDDHCIIMNGWDTYVRSKVLDLELDTKDVWCLIPKFDNVGAMNQILSRGYINALGGLGRHGWIDSYINDVNRAMGTKFDREHVVRFDDEMLTDYTHDKPSQLDDSRTKTVLSKEASLLPKYTDDMVKRWIDEDADKLRRAMG